MAEKTLTRLTHRSQRVDLFRISGSIGITVASLKVTETLAILPRATPSAMWIAIRHVATIPYPPQHLPKKILNIPAKNVDIYYQAKLAIIRAGLCRQTSVFRGRPTRRCWGMRLSPNTVGTIGQERCLFRLGTRVDSGCAAGSLNRQLNSPTCSIPLGLAAFSQEAGMRPFFLVLPGEWQPCHLAKRCHRADNGPACNRFPRNIVPTTAGRSAHAILPTISPASRPSRDMPSEPVTTLC